MNKEKKKKIATERVISTAKGEFLYICKHENYTFPVVFFIFKIKARCIVTSPTSTDVAEKFIKTS